MSESDWTAGYVADVGYTFGYYSELNPLRSSLALLGSGVVPPRIRTACELGFGQGLSANLHAAASEVDWWGTDFNPAQAGFARELSSISGADLKLYDQAFADFCNRPDLPEFDFIALHGIWSWISDDNRKIIVDFVRRKLSVGGILYVSYNTMPGWAGFAPIRHLMTQHAEIIGAEGSGIVSRIDGAMDFAERLLATQPLYGVINPQVVERVKKLKDQNRHYLAHEYFNRDWHPIHFATMAQWLEPAKVEFAGSAHLIDHIDVVNLTADQQKFLGEFTDPSLKQSVRDFMVNQQFRRDYLVKGVRRLSLLERSEAIKALKVVMTTHRADVSLKVNGAMGEASLSEEIYNPILDLMADYKVRNVADIQSALKGQNIELGKIVQAVMILTGTGQMTIAQDDDVAAARKPYTDRVNAWLYGKARTNGDISYIASPVTGGGVAAGRLQQLFIMAMGQGRRQPDEWAQFAWDILSMQGQGLIKEGKALQTPEENLAELKSEAAAFAAKRLPLLKALQVI